MHILLIIINYMSMLYVLCTGNTYKNESNHCTDRSGNMIIFEINANPKKFMLHDQENGLNLNDRNICELVACISSGLNNFFGDRDCKPLPSTSDASKEVDTKKQKENLKETEKDAKTETNKTINKISQSDGPSGSQCPNTPINHQSPSISESNSLSRQREDKAGSTSRNNNGQNKSNA